jgi:hypothetical protein
VERCYEGKDACEKLAAAVDGCVAEVCDPYCNGKDAPAPAP